MLLGLNLETFPTLRRVLASNREIYLTILDTSILVGDFYDFLTTPFELKYTMNVYIIEKSILKKKML